MVKKRARSGSWRSAAVLLAGLLGATLVPAAPAAAVPGRSRAQQPASPYPCLRTRRTGICAPSAARSVLDWPRRGWHPHAQTTNKWDNEPARGHRRRGHVGVVPTPAWPLDLGIEPQGSHPRSRRQP